MSTAAGRSRERYRRIAASAVSSLGAKITGICAVLITVPLTVGYLGAERFGLWMTISSISTLLSFADFGVGGGLLNAIARADGRNDRVGAQRAVSSAFAFLTAVALLLAGAFGAVYPLLSWESLFRVVTPLAVEEAGMAVAVFLICSALSVPLSIAQRVQMGFQEGFQSNLWQAAGTLVGLAGVIAVVYSGKGLPWLVLAHSGGPVIVMLVNCVVEFGWRRRWLAPRARNVDRAVTRKLLGAGGIFAILQLLAFLGATSDNFIIAQLFGASAVAGYAVVYKLFTAVFIVQVLISSLWPAFGEALAREDRAAARSMFERSLKLCSIMGVVIAAAFVLAGQKIIELWVGSELVPTLSMLAGFGAWIIVASLYAPVAALLSTEGLLEHQLRIYSLAALSAFLLKIASASVFGIEGVIWATAAGYGLFAFHARRVARGILAANG